jgi:hypothetical protein
MKCPVCGSLNFFVKDPDDEYETFEFELKDATIVYNSEADESETTPKSFAKNAPGMTRSRN